MESQIFFSLESRNLGILESWEHGIPEAGNLGKPESRNPLAVFWIPCRIVVLVNGVFAENWSEISRFVLFLDKKTSKKQDVPIIKNRYVLQK